MTVERKAKCMAKGKISPKAKWATFLPIVGTVVLALVNEVLGPHVDSTTKVAVVGLVNALLALAGALWGEPGQVMVNE